MQTLEQLNQQFKIEDQLSFYQNKEGFILMEIVNKHAKAVISMYAGQILSYQPHDQAQDLVFVSEQCVFEDEHAVRGGIPICWPWFGEAKHQQNLCTHGFVRTQHWDVLACQQNNNGSHTVHLGVTANEQTHALWPYQFNLGLKITVGQQLDIELITHNQDEQAFTISQALHTYFDVSHIDNVRVEGLKGLTYLDKVLDFAQGQQEQDIMVEQEFDRVYLGRQQTVQLFDKGYQRRITINGNGPTVIVWNPWTTAVNDIPDLASDDYQKFICVESANAANESVTLEPNQRYSLKTSYAIAAY